MLAFSLPVTGSLWIGAVAKVSPHAGDHRPPVEGLLKQRIDIAAILGRQLGQRAAEIVGDRQLGSEYARVAKLPERIGVGKGNGRRHHERDRPRVRTFESGTRQAELVGQRLDSSAALIRSTLAEAAVAVQRDRTIDRAEGAEAPVLILDEELLVEQPPP